MHTLLGSPLPNVRNIKNKATDPADHEVPDGTFGLRKDILHGQDIPDPDGSHVDGISADLDHLMYSIKVISSHKCLTFNPSAMVQ